jgi:hypothetical protein
MMSVERSRTAVAEAPEGIVASAAVPMAATVSHLIVEDMFQTNDSIVM